MVADELVAFARANLPAVPARVLEIGAGRGELAAALRDAGYEVTAIDPAAEPDSGVEAIPLLEARGSFDAAVAIVSLHHVDPLAESVEHLASLLPEGAPLIIDELDSERYDERATEWWLHQRRARGAAPGHPDTTAEQLVSELRHHVHPWREVAAALAAAGFGVGEPVRGPYLHRWELGPELRAAEEREIASGTMPAVGLRTVAVRRGR